MWNFPEPSYSHLKPTRGKQSTQTHLITQSSVFGTFHLQKAHLGNLVFQGKHFGKRLSEQFRVRKTGQLNYHNGTNHAGILNKCPLPTAQHTVHVSAKFAERSSPGVLKGCALKMCITGGKSKEGSGLNTDEDEEKWEQRKSSYERRCVPEPERSWKGGWRNR